MTGEDNTPVHVPGREELDACVLERADAAVGEDSQGDAAPEAPHDVPATSVLTLQADALLRHAANPAHLDMPMEARWAAIGVTSGSVKDRLLRELRGLGFIRLEKKGPCRTIYIYKKGWEYLGLTAPKGLGRGGAVHRRWVAHLKGLFRQKGYDVRVEIEVGKEKKRVDMVAFGAQKIAIEIAITSVTQEVANLKADLRSDAIDRVLVASPDVELLARIKERAQNDSDLAGQMDRVRFYRLIEKGGV